MRELITEAGLEVDLIKSQGGMWATIYQMRNNVLYHSFRTQKGFFTKLKKILFIDLGLTALRNRFAIWLDKKLYNEVLTLNYMVVAHKPGS